MVFMLTNYMRNCPLTTLTLVAVLVLSLAPIGQVEVAKDVPFADKWTHLVMYGGLCLVGWLEFWKHHRRLDSRQLCLAILAPVMLGGVLELLQAFVTTYRSGEWMDFLADSVGVLLGTLLGQVFRLWKKEGVR